MASPAFSASRRRNDGASPPSPSTQGTPSWAWDGTPCLGKNRVQEGGCSGRGSSSIPAASSGTRLVKKSSSCFRTGVMANGPEGGGTETTRTEAESAEGASKGGDIADDTTSLRTSVATTAFLTGGLATTGGGPSMAGGCLSTTGSAMPATGPAMAGTLVSIGAHTTRVSDRPTSGAGSSACVPESP